MKKMMTILLVAFTVITTTGLTGCASLRCYGVEAGGC